MRILTLQTCSKTRDNHSDRQTDTEIIIDKSDIRHHLPRFQPENMEKNAAMGLEVQKVAKAKGCTPAQVALAWVRSYSGKEGFPTIIPIPGSTTEERTIENGKEVTLSDEELKKIEEIMKKTQVLGGRY